jgi:hypothetical protein
MRFDRPLLSFKHASTFLKALNDSGELHLLGLGPKPATEPTGTGLTDQEEENLRKRTSELYSLNWKPHGFESWIAYVGSLPCTMTLQQMKAGAFAHLMKDVPFEEKPDLNATYTITRKP